MSISRFVTHDMVVCDLEDYETKYAHRGHAVLHAAKEPYHRQFVGYTTPGAPKTSSEYLYATRYAGKELALNMVDAPRMEFFSPVMLMKGLEFLWEHDRMQQRDYLLVLHCNEGCSRAPSLALVYLALVKRQVYSATYEDAAQDFRKRLFPEYAPGQGLQQHLATSWSMYRDTLKGW